MDIGRCVIALRANAIETLDSKYNFFLKIQGITRSLKLSIADSLMCLLGRMSTHLPTCGQPKDVRDVSKRSLSNSI